MLAVTQSSMSLSVPTVFESTFFDSVYLNSSNADAPPVRVGVLVDSNHVMAAFATVIDQISRSNFAQLVAVVRNASEAPVAAPPPKSFGKLSTVARMLSDPKERRRIAWTAYSQLDRQRYPAAADLMKLVDCSDAFAGAVQIDAVPVGKGFVHRFTPDVIAQLRDLKIDVLLRFGFNIIRGDMLRVARYGLWSYHHGDNEFYRGGPPCYWELVEGNPCTGVILQVLNEELDNGQVIDKAIVSSTLRMSHGENQMAPYLTASRMMMRALYRLHQGGWDEVQRHAPPDVRYAGRQSLYRSPGNVETCRFVASKLAQTLGRRLKFSRSQGDYWQIGLRPRSQPGVLPSSLSGVLWRPNPAGTFHADPFLIENAGRTWLFAEEYVYSTGRGRLVCSEVRSVSDVSEAQVILDEPWHLSNPFVFRLGSDFFMIPESRKSGKVTLYRATDFPFRWVKERNLFEFGGLDTNVFQHDGLWWILTTVADPPGSGPQLCLFHTKDLFAPATLHPSSPVAADVRHARSGGRVHVTSEGMWRVAQDCSVRYGYALQFRRITELTTRNYREEHHSSIYPPGDGIVGVHAWDATQKFEAFDSILHPAPL